MLTDGIEVRTPDPEPSGVLAWERALAREDVAPNVIEPWVALPSQLCEGARAAERSGEKRLMAAVLADAIRLYLKLHGAPGARAQILLRETERWLWSSDRGWLLACETVCDVLGIDADRLRRALLAHAASGERPSIPCDAGRVRVARGRKIRV